MAQQAYGQGVRGLPDLNSDLLLDIFALCDVPAKQQASTKAAYGVQLMGSPSHECNR